MSYFRSVLPELIISLRATLKNFAKCIGNKMKISLKYKLLMQTNHNLHRKKKHQN